MIKVGVSEIVDLNSLACSLLGGARLDERPDRCDSLASRPRSCARTATSAGFRLAATKPATNAVRGRLHFVSQMRNDCQLELRFVRTEAWYAARDDHLAAHPSTGIAV
jgi:hypothetical protein